jgi:hypothetical protein
MTHFVYSGTTLRQQWLDETREYTEYDDQGILVLTRPYTAEENKEADDEASTLAVEKAEADLARAIALASAPAELQALQQAHLSAEGIEEGDPWRQPTGAHDAYPLGAVVSHADELWESTVAANVWEPGVSGWKITGPGIPPWIQPTGAHDDYNTGDIVSHEGKVWQSNIDGNVWEPPEQWTEVTLRRET